VSIQTVKSTLPDAIRLAAELVRQPSFSEQEFEQLRQEVLASAEFARSEPQAIASLSIARHLNPYPKGHVRYVPSIDERVDDLKAVKLDDVKRFHKEFYGSSNGELAIVGDFDADAIKKLVAELFGDWKSPKRFADAAKPYREISPVNQSFQIPDKANAVFVAGMPLRLTDQDKDYAPLVLANYMIGGHSSSRLYTRIRAKEGFSYGVSSSLSVIPGQNGAEFVISAIVAPQAAERGEAGSGDEGGVGARVERRLSSRRTRQREEGLAGGAARQPIPGSGARRPAPVAAALGPHDDVRCRAGEARGSADCGGDRRCAAATSRRAETEHLQGRRSEEGWQQRPVTL
jgi:zinc protease